MKIALCLSGQPRFYRKAYQLSYDTFYRDREFDVFLHAWHNPETEGKQYHASSGFGGGPIEKNVGASLVNLFGPKKHVILPQKNFDTAGYHVDGKYDNPHLFANFSWPYSIQMAGNLLREYEQEQGFTYDLVVVMRYDLEFFTRVPLEGLDPNVMHTLDTGLGLTFALCDQFFVSGRQNIELIFDLYDHMHRYFRERDTFNTERNSFNLMVENNVPMNLLPIPYRIIRG